MLRGNASPGCIATVDNLLETPNEFQICGRFVHVPGMLGIPRTRLDYPVLPSIAALAALSACDGSPTPGSIIRVNHGKMRHTSRQHTSVWACGQP